MIALDTETTGLDGHHGALPYFVTIATHDQGVLYWQWEVDPLTRDVYLDKSDLEQIVSIVDDAEGVVGHNIKFDAATLAVALNAVGISWQWPWEKTEDTLRAGHLLASNQPHNLTDMVLQWLADDIEPHEIAMKAVVEKARNMVLLAQRRHKRKEQSAADTVEESWEGVVAASTRKRKGKKALAVQPGLFPGLLAEEEINPLASWAVATRTRPDMPSCSNPKTNLWKCDGWLPRALFLAGVEDIPPEWAQVPCAYANADSEATLALWTVLEREIKRRKLSKVYRAMMETYPAALAMEQGGVSINSLALKTQRQVLEEKSADAEQLCLDIAKSYNFDLQIPKSGANNSLKSFCYDVLKLPPQYNKKSKTGAPTLDHAAMEWYESKLDRGSKPQIFVKSLLHKRKMDTGIGFINSYERFWLPTDVVNEKGETLWYMLYPNLNPTGTDTLRWSSSNPNSQNVSKQEESGLRMVFGPMPGREWWSLDAKNIELRIPAFEAGETELMQIFSRPDDPPFYGSYHLVVFDTLYPELYAKYGKHVKGPYPMYEATLYQWIKNGNFAVIYGAQRKTADAAYHYDGAFDLVRERFPNIAALSEKQKRLANKLGYVETIPDRSIDPEHGYPLICTRTEDGSGVLPTIPLNYHVSGTAMQWMARAMVRCHNQLRQWRLVDQFDGRMVLQVHDELVFDFPRRGDPIAEHKAGGPKGPLAGTSNLRRVRELQSLMEVGGEHIGIPTPVSVEYHTESWAVGQAV